MIFLIRHATNDLVGKVIPGWMPGLHLNAEGREQADRLARGLRGQGITRVFSSPLERAMETAAPLAGVCGISVEVRERLGELPPGEFSGRTLEDLETDPRWRQFNQFRG
ncbi:MAG TPA: histidine phosphatase family protein, partial [Bryobacteraceae bacterium]|nr:histidine phosphatase family protein [Bryobacteraceae bacterium]